MQNVDGFSALPHRLFRITTSRNGCVASQNVYNVIEATVWIDTTPFANLFLFYFIFTTKRLSVSVLVFHVAKESAVECCASCAREERAHTRGSANRKFTFKMIFVLHINVFVDATRYTPTARERGR